jgi:hypothetical protein
MESVQSQRSAQDTTRTESFPGEEAVAKLRQALEIEVRRPLSGRESFLDLNALSALH